MPMKKMRPAESPAAYVAKLDGWQAKCVRQIRFVVRASAKFDERIKWGNLVFAHRGLSILIHVEDHRVVFGFFRGKRLTALEPRIRPSGKYELGNIVFFEGDDIESAQVERLAREAARLNGELGDPTALS